MTWTGLLCCWMVCLQFSSLTKTLSLHEFTRYRKTKLKGTKQEKKTTRHSRSFHFADIFYLKAMTALHLLPFLALVMLSADALDNGLARTPPMGWLSWQRFRCNTDCKNDPHNCISEQLYKDMADHLVSDGYKDAGYEYVNIDDCWAAKQRDPLTNALVADPDRFPSGIKALADYVHSKGLKLGIYGDMGTLTCGGYPGSKFTMEQDAQTFADWGIDSFKMDGCYSDTADFATAYPIMEFYLNKTGRPILFSCSWPAYELNQKNPIPYSRIAHYCNIWRNFDDIDDSWDSVKSIIKWTGDNKWNFSAVVGPGNFNDPDMIIVGNKGLSASQERAQMALWAVMAAPLLLSADLRSVSEESRQLMLHPGVIEVNQDRLGKMGYRIWAISNVQIWVREVLPQGSYAVAILNENDGGYGNVVEFSCAFILTQKSYKLTDIFEGKDMGTYTAKDVIKVPVDVSSVFFGKFVPVS